MLETLTAFLAGIDYALILSKIVSIIVILIVTAIITKVIRKAVQTIPNRSRKVTPMLASLIARTLNLIVWIFSVISLLQTVGFNLTPIITGLGVTGVVLGFALQESIASFFAGFLIALNNPFRVGDYVSINGTEGIVVAMDLMCVILNTTDKQKITLANKNVWGNTIVNYSDVEERLVDTVIPVAYDTIVPKAKRVIKGLIKNYGEVKHPEDAIVEVNQLGSSSIDLIVRFSVPVSDFWKVYWRFLDDVIVAFRKEGIEIPYNRVDVSLLCGEKLKNA